MKKLVFAMLALMVVMTAAEAQTVKVKGAVKDAKTDEALPLVNVGLMRNTDTVFVRGAASDFDGEFEIGQPQNLLRLIQDGTAPDVDRRFAAEAKPAFLLFRVDEQRYQQPLTGG